MSRLRNLWENLRSSLWFMPAVIVLAAIVLAVGLIELDASATGWKLAERWPRMFGAGAEGARGLLSAIAGSMITVAGVTFSITIVALALASSQYTSRILRNFMSDRASQSMLGVFVGVFAYCLVVLRTVRSGNDEHLFVPSLAVMGAVVLAMVAIGFFIFFIHHIAASIQASSVIAAAADETLQAVDRLFPEEVGEVAENSAGAEHYDLESKTWIVIPSRKTGYIQAINADALFDLAREIDAVVRMERGVGEFIIEDGPLASVSGASYDDDAIEKLNAAFTVGRHRTMQQDAAYGIRQIVDIALKALSPGINDTTTAINCIDYLGAILARLAGRSIQSPYRSDDARLRLITRGSTFVSLLNEAFDQIRQNAEGNVAVLRRLLATLGVIAGRTSNAGRRLALAQHARLIMETAERTVASLHDRARIQAIADVLAPGSAPLIPS